MNLGARILISLKKHEARRKEQERRERDLRERLAELALVVELETLAKEVA